MHYLSIDIGGTNLKYALLDKSGTLVQKWQRPTPKQSLNELLHVLKEIVSVHLNRIKGIAISCPGKVDKKQGIIYFGGSLTFLNHLHLKDILEKEFSLPVAVENDGKSAALAELWLGNLRNICQGAAIVFGTGVGGGLIINGNLFSGQHFQAGEFSFLLNRVDEPTIDHLLGFNTSAVAMINQISQQLGWKSKNDGIKVFQAICAGNGTANRIFNQFCQRAALLISNIQAIVDLERYVIGGGISSQPILIKRINEYYDIIRRKIPILGDTLARPEIVSSRFHNDANLYGALYRLFLEMEKGEGANGIE